MNIDFGSVYTSVNVFKMGEELYANKIGGSALEVADEIFNIALDKRVDQINIDSSGLGMAVRDHLERKIQDHGLNIILN